MTSHLDLLAVTLVSCAVSCAAGTELEPVPSAADPPATPRLGLPPLAPGATAPSATAPSASTTTSTATPPPAPREVSGSHTLDVSCGDVPVIHVCVLGEEADEDVAFTLPPGTKRSSILYTIAPHGAAGGSVGWASQDALDGTVHLHGFADAFSSVSVTVTGIIVVPE